MSQDDKMRHPDPYGAVPAVCRGRVLVSRIVLSHILGPNKYARLSR